MKEMMILKMMIWKMMILKMMILKMMLLKMMILKGVFRVSKHCGEFVREIAVRCFGEWDTSPNSDFYFYNL